MTTVNLEVKRNGQLTDLTYDNRDKLRHIQTILFVKRYIICLHDQEINTMHAIHIL